MKNITFFQASNLTDAEVKEQFVVRQKELNQILSEIKQDDMKGSIQHYILIGQRGSGKSTLLRRIQAEINLEKNLNKRLIAVNLSEEQAGIYRLHDLWDRVAEELRNQGLEVEEVNWEKYQDDLPDFARALYQAVQNALKSEKKKLVLLLDNIDRVLENIRKDDNHLFRELLMNHKDVRIIGGSTRLSEHHWKYDEPFYQFFQIIRLNPLTEAEMKELLVFWSEFMGEPKLKDFAERHSGKLNAVRILSDGMPRTMLHLVELLINKPEEHGYTYLKSIVDKATPIYQERLGMLSPLQQKITMELSFFWDAVKVKEIAHAARMESKTVSAVLKQLVDLKIVEKRKGTDKNMFYLLRERFFNLWLIMTQGGPKQKSRVKWLTVFLETWYEPNELRNAYLKFCQDLNSGKLNPDHAIVMAKAFVHSRLISAEDRDSLLESFHKISIQNQDYLQLLPKKTQEIYDEVHELADKGKWRKAVSILEDIEQDDILKFEWLGFCLDAAKEPDGAKSNYIKAVELGSGLAACNLAHIYLREGSVKMAEQQYLTAIELEFTEAIYNLGLMYYNQKRFEKAELYFNQAIESGIKAAMNDLAILYAKQKKYDSAEKLFLEAVEFADDTGLVCGNLAFLYENLGNQEFELKWYQEGFNRGNSNLGYSLAACLYNNCGDSELARNAMEAYFEVSNAGSMPLEKRFFRIIVELWSGRPEILEESYELVEYAVEHEKFEDVLRFCLTTLVHYQTATVWNLFSDKKLGSKLKETLIPLYYVTATLLNTAEGRKALTSMPPEHKETVDEIVNIVKEQRARFYK